MAQSPQKMSFQAVVRNNSNTLISNQPVGLKISILQGSATGAAVYTETQTANTNSNGLVTIQIGGGAVLLGDFATIDWSNGPYFIQTDTDVNGGTNYTLTSTTQLLSVPYALYAQTSGSSIPGPQGATGPAGANGLNGVDGVNGANGAQGPQGIAGDSGINGQDGLSAYQIWLNAGNTGTEEQFINSLHGQTGPQGPIGLTGATGATGAQGQTGATGPQGLQGVIGLTGATGPQGQQGVIGLTGANGLQGQTGPQGPIGLTGATGPQGPQGIIGLTGANGATGAQGPIGLTGATGPQGPQGVNGLTGATGATGAQGQTGATGPQGPIGLPGATGAQGPIGLSGANGTNGLSAYQIWLNAGNAGTQAQFLTSLQGVTGVAGIAGTNGTNGVDGKNTLVNTTTEAAGANCAAGGTKVEVGLDANNNGTLDANEINSSLTKYVCNGASNILPVGNSGSILYSNGTSWVNLNSGIQGQVLTMNNGLPTWSNAQTLNTGLTPNVNSVSVSYNYNINIFTINGALLPGPTNTDYGFVWSTSPNPTIQNNYISMGVGTIGSQFSNTLNISQFVQPNTTYYFKAYASNNYGISYGQQLSFTTGPFLSGQNYQGGKIAYIDETGQHGIIMSGVLGNVPYGCRGVNLGASNNSIGGGILNTNAINNTCNEGSFAAKLCLQYNGGGFSDWYLPNSNEFQKILINTNTLGLVTLGYSYGTQNFWTSLEIDSINALTINIDSNGWNLWTAEKNSGGWNIYYNPNFKVIAFRNF